MNLVASMGVSLVVPNMTSLYKKKFTLVQQPALTCNDQADKKNKKNKTVFEQNQKNKNNNKDNYEIEIKMDEDFLTRKQF